MILGASGNHRRKKPDKKAKPTIKTLQVILHTPLGRFDGKPDTFDLEAYDTLKKIGENLYNLNTFTMQDVHGDILYFSPEVIKNSILELKIMGSIDKNSKT